MMAVQKNAQIDYNCLLLYKYSCKFRNAVNGGQCS